MKKLIALILALTLALTLCACGQKASEATQSPAEGSSQAPAASGEGDRPKGQPPVKNTGSLSLLNMTEEAYAAFVETRKKVSNKMMEEGYAVPSDGNQDAPPEGRIGGDPPEGAPDHLPEKGNGKVIYYDTLDALLMALNAGDIEGIEIYQSVAHYLCATNDNLKMLTSYDTAKERNTFAELVQNGVNGNDFAFLMMEGNAALWGEFNTAIEAMKTDGILDRLVEEQIDDLIDGGEIKPIALPHFDGAETVKVAVTGALPPMDYVAADGIPAGFNTAVLAEIANRTGKNIELVVVDSLGRAAALASGAVDAVFWTRTSSEAQKRAAMSEAEREAKKAEQDANMSEEEIKLLHEVSESINFSVYAGSDMPDSTITTAPYFSDVLVTVTLSGGPQGK